MSGRQLDLPLEGTPAGRLLPWIVAGLVYLAVLALAAAAVADGAVRLFELRPRVLTVGLPPAAAAPGEARGGGAGGEAGETAGPAGEEAPDVAAAVAVLRATPGIVDARPVPAEEVRKLVGPWLGADRGAAGGQGGGGGPSLPRLIDATVDRGAALDPAALEERLRAAVPGASVDRGALDAGRAEALARHVRALALAAGAAVVAAALVVVGVVTRMSLGLHRDTVELLRLMGAPGGYLARQFERHALLAGLRGGLLGFTAAVLTVLALVHGSRLIELMGTTLPLHLRPVDWIALACVPVAGALLITAVARLTALRGLAPDPLDRFTHAASGHRWKWVCGFGRAGRSPGARRRAARARSNSAGMAKLRLAAASYANGHRRSAGCGSRL